MEREDYLLERLRSISAALAGRRMMRGRETRERLLAEADRRLDLLSELMRARALEGAGEPPERPPEPFRGAAEGPSTPPARRTS